MTNEKAKIHLITTFVFLQFITNKNIDAVPTIFLMSASGKMEKYQGPRDAPTLLQQLAARRVIKTMY